MSTRTRTAKTTDATPAKKTAAKRTSSSDTPAQPARKRAPRKTTAPALSLVKPRKPLPTRDDLPFMTDVQGYATLAARIAGITTDRIRDWRDWRDGTATRRLSDGAFLRYTLATRTLIWQARCPMGVVHEYEIGSPSATSAARVRTAACTTPHHDLTTVQRLTADELAEWGILAAPTTVPANALPGEPATVSQVVPLPVKARALGDELTHSDSSTADTQPLAEREIADGLTARADQDQPREHPAP